MKMDFIETERAHQLELLRQGFFEDAEPGGYVYSDKGINYYDFVLKPQCSLTNLYKPIRKEVLQYFERYDIAWWRQHEDRYFPTGHLLSSQIHCLNHLFALRKDPDAVLEIIKPIGIAAGINFDKVLPSFIDTHEAYYDRETGKKVSNSNYISFEFVCHNIDMLGETHEKRGAKCTSVDALVYAQAGNERWLIPIEWKYTESYDHKKEAYSFERYSKVVSNNSRLEGWTHLYKHDPFYELGRQTLLMEKLIERKPMVGKISHRFPQYPLAADNFLHVVVVPKDNLLMRADTDKFKASLKQNYRNLFQVVDSQTLLSNIQNKYSELTAYLQARYWYRQ